jgi:hypothetical protein
MIQMAYVKSSQIQESDNEDEEEESESNSSSKDSPINMKKLMYEPKRNSDTEKTPLSIKTPDMKALRLNLFKVATGESAGDQIEIPECESRVGPVKETPAFYYKQLSEIAEVRSPESRPTMVEFEDNMNSPDVSRSPVKSTTNVPCSLVMESEYNPEIETRGDQEAKALGEGGFSKMVQGIY